MTSETKFFDDCRELFLTDGWKAFKDEVIVGLNSVHVASLESADDFWKAKGRVEALSQIVGWEDAVLAAEAQQEADSEDSYEEAV